MELRHLASFLAVVEEGQFARAATRLFLSPPAVTGHVRQLEQELGVRLLERSPLALTAAGERFLPHARAAVAAANAAVESVAEPPGEPATLRVGVMVNGSSELTPAILRAFRRARPGTRLDLRSLNFTEHISALLEHSVDVAFVRPVPNDDRVRADVLTTEQRVLVVPTSMPQAEAESLLLADVLDLPYVGLPSCTPRVFADYLYFADARGGEVPHFVPELVRTPQDVLTLVAAGRAVGSALHSFGRYYPWPGTCTVPILDAPWEHTVLATRAGDRNPDVTAFRALATRLADLVPVDTDVRAPGMPR